MEVILFVLDLILDVEAIDFVELGERVVVAVDEMSNNPETVTGLVALLSKMFTTNMFEIVMFLLVRTFHFSEVTLSIFSARLT